VTKFHSMPQFGCDWTYAATTTNKGHFTFLQNCGSAGGKLDNIHQTFTVDLFFVLACLYMPNHMRYA